MPRDADFLTAIIADPESDGPRLIYADWLEESGQDARAEFIRVQCAVAALPEADLDIHPLVARENELWRSHRDEWVRPLDALLFADGSADWFAPVRAVAEFAGAALGIGRRDNFLSEFVRVLAADRWTFRRGFAEKLRCGMRDFLRAAPDIARTTPLRSLTLSLGDEEPLESLANCPQLDRLESLRVYAAQASNIDSQPLLASGQLTALRRFGLHHFHLSPHELQAFAESSLLNQLTDLELSITGANLESRRALLASPALRSLTRLALQSFWTQERAAPLIADWPACDKLTDLDLAGNEIGDADWTAILDRSPALLSLNLSQTQLSDVGLRPLVRSPRTRQLQWLNLSGNPFGDQSALDLIDSPHLMAPTRLILRDCNLHERVRQAIAVRWGDRAVF